MLYALDLTQRQTRRVLEQALRGRALVDIEPRTLADDDPIRGRLTAIDGNLLSIELDDDGREISAADIVGTFCSVQTALSERLYFFEACALDLYDACVPRRILLSAPDSIQVGNRRKFIRQHPVLSATVEIDIVASPEFCAGELYNISGNGLACRVAGEMDGALLIGDPVHVRFTVPGLHAEFDLAAIICAKTPAASNEAIILGLQFCPNETNAQEMRAIEELRCFLSDATAFGDTRETPE